MYLNKVVTVIAGFAQCTDFNYSCYVAENLSNILPNFTVKIVTRESSAWKDWLKEKCEIHNWCHNESPLIWRENGICGGRQTYIGGLVEFKELINHYYGVREELSREEQNDMDFDYAIAQNIALHVDESKGMRSNILHITIIGAGRSVCPDLVAQLATLREINQDGISINLYDTPGHFFKIKDIVRDAIAIGGGLCSIRNLASLSDGLKNCNIMIILDHIPREDHEETTHNWLLKNYQATKEIANQINTHAPSDIRIIFCTTGPSCFCANVMLEEAHNLNKNNVIAISAHYGLEMMYDFVKFLNIDHKEIGCPPVWGFLGMNEYVDYHHTVQKCSVYLPNKRASACDGNSTLPLGTKFTEFRWLSYLSFDKNPHEILAKNKSICSYQVGRTEDFQKCKAICDFLKLWYQKDESKIGDEIISLGIMSDGSFNIPEGIYFSQPVHLKILDDNSRVWVPCSEFPVPCDPVALETFASTAKFFVDNIDFLKIEANQGSAGSTTTDEF